MMKKIAKLGSVFLAGVMILGLAGCSENQIKTAAQTAGLTSSVAWIASKAPSAEEKDLVSKTLDLIVANATAVQGGATYTEVVYPKLLDFVRSDSVPDQYEAAVLAGGLAALNGLDMVLATNPELLEKQELLIKVVNSFVMGAKTGLALDDNDERILQAKRIVEANQRNVGQARVFVFE